MGRRLVTSDSIKFRNFIESWTDIEVKGDAEKNIMAFARGLYMKIIEESPVLEGKYRANLRWDLHVDSNVTVDAPENPPTRGSMPTQDEWNNSNYYLTKSRFKIGDTIVLSNHVPYVLKVEYDGWANTNAYKPFGRAYTWVVSNPDKTITIGKTEI